MISGEDTMQIEPGNFIRAAGRSGPLLAVGIIVAASSLVSSGCHRTTAPDQRPVVIGMPAEVSQKVDNAQAAFIDSMSTLATNYDEAVCEQRGEMADSSHDRQARAEARLEVADAVSNAREQVTPNRGGGPVSEAERITIIEEEPVDEPNRGGWTCMQANQEPACVSAAASGVASKVYRNYVKGYSLNPVTAGDVLEAFAADAKWADEYFMENADRGEALGAIEQACQDGQSPLKRFFEAAADFDQPQVRRDLLAVRDGFVGPQQDVCNVLPSYYSNVMGELKNDLDLRIRTQRCAMPQWNVLWDE
jgi:hypothetical protein